MLFRNCVFTCNNFTEQQYDEIFNLDVWKYIVIGKEVGDSGTPHLQGYGVFHKRMRCKKVHEMLQGCHVEPRKGTHLQASEYCKKDGDYQERGDPPKQGERTDLQEAINKIKGGSSVTEVARSCSEVFVKYSRGLRELALAVQEPYNHATVRGVWIYGPPGTGKSHSARHFDPDAYLKPQNKWWDGYSGQATVILDDLDTNVLGHYLKIWSDRWACTGETKGGTVQLRHKLFVVTSNYSIEELFGSDNNLCAAIARRFKVVHKVDRNLIVDYLILN